jgi:O-antigen/teichoic acid export membrane protein
MRALSVTFLASVLIHLVNIATGVLAARLLGPEGRGELAVVFLWPSLLAGMGMLGLHEAVAYAGAARTLSPRRIFGSSLVMGALLAVPLVLIGFAAFPLAYGDFRPEVLDIGLLYLAFVPLNLLTMFPTSLLQGTMQLKSWNLLRVQVHAVYLLALLVLWAMDAVSVRNMAIAMLLANLLNLFVGYGLCAKRSWLSFKADLEAIRTLLRYGLKVHLGLMGRLANLWLDQAFIALLLTAADLGHYVVAATIARGVGMVATPIELVAFPKIAAEPTADGKAQLFCRYMKINFLLVLPAGIVLAALTPWILSTIFGPAFLPSARVAHVLILANVILTGTLMLSAALKAYDRAMLIAKVEGIDVIVTVAALSLLVPAYGIEGAAYAMLIVNIFTFALLAFWVRRDLGISFARLFRPTRQDVDWVVGAMRPGH